MPKSSKTILNIYTAPEFISLAIIIVTAVLFILHTGVYEKYLNTYEGRLAMKYLKLILQAKCAVMCVLGALSTVAFLFINHRRTNTITEANISKFKKVIIATMLLTIVPSILACGLYLPAVTIRTLSLLTFATFVLGMKAFVVLYEATPRNK